MIKFPVLSSYDVEISQCFNAVRKWMSRTVILLRSKGNLGYFGQYRILYEGCFLMCVAACRSGETLQGHSFGLIWGSITLSCQQSGWKSTSLGMLRTLEHQCRTWMETISHGEFGPRAFTPRYPKPGRAEEPRRMN